jgi:hypothetical protein
MIVSFLLLIQWSNTLQAPFSKLLTAAFQGLSLAPILSCDGQTNATMLFVLGTGLENTFRLTEYNIP